MRVSVVPLAVACLPALASTPPKLYVSGYAAPAASTTVGAGLCVAPDASVFPAARSYTPGSGASSWSISRLSPRGQVLWTRAGFPGPGDDALRHATVLLDATGALFIAWAAPADAPAILRLDPATGATLWSAPFPAGGRGSIGLADAAASPDGHLIVTGAALLDGDEDWVTAALDRDTGALLWSTRENGTAGGPDGINDAPASLTIDADGSITVAGTLQVGDNPDDEEGLFAPAAARYDLAGHRLWRTLLGDARNTGQAARILTGADGSPILLANRAGTILTAGLDPATGAVRWADDWAGPAGQGAVVFDAARHPDGDILLAGGACGSSPWCAGGQMARRLSPSGLERWSSYFFNTAVADPYSGSARAIALSPAGTVFTAGLERTGLFGFGSSGIVMALDGDSGSILWTDTFIPPATVASTLTAIATDPGGDAILAGSARPTAATSSLLAFRYGCAVDFNADDFVDFFDYDDFVACFEGSACPPARDSDFNGDGFADFFDYDDFVAAFEAGC